MDSDNYTQTRGKRASKRRGSKDTRTGRGRGRVAGGGLNKIPSPLPFMYLHSSIAIHTTSGWHQAWCPCEMMRFSQLQDFSRFSPREFPVDCNLPDHPALCALCMADGTAALLHQGLIEALPGNKAQHNSVSTPDMAPECLWSRNLLPRMQGRVSPSNS